MKPYDFLKAMELLPQRYADELRQWQESGAPISGSSGVFGKRNREETPMKQATQTQTDRLREEISVTKLRPLNAAICAGLAVCLIAAAVFGSKALTPQPGLPAGTPPSSSEIKPQEAEPVKENDWSLSVTAYYGDDIPVPAEGMVRRLETIEESSSYVTDSGQQNREVQYLLTHHHLDWETDPDCPWSNVNTCLDDYPAEERERIQQEAWAQEPQMYDLLLVAVPVPAYTLSMGYQYAGFTPEGKLLINFTATPGETQGEKGENYYLLLMLPEGTMPAVDENSFEITFSYYDQPFCVKTEGRETFPDNTAPTLSIMGGKPFTNLNTASGADVLYPSRTWFLARTPSAPEGFSEPRLRILRNTDDVFALCTAEDFPYPMYLTNGRLGASLEVLTEQYDLLTVAAPMNTANAFACENPVLLPDGTLSMRVALQDYPGAPTENGVLFAVYAFRKGVLPDACGVTVETVRYACESANDVSADLLRAANHIPALYVMPQQPAAVTETAETEPAAEVTETAAVTVTAAETDTVPDAAVTWYAPPAVDNGQTADVFRMLDCLNYHAVSCDGLPEYKLTASDGTVYLLNFSGSWVWRRPSLIADADNEAPLTQEVIDAINANWGNLNIVKADR